MKKLLTLVLAGVAIKYFLDSAKGNDVRTKLKGWLSEAQDSFSDLAGKVTQKAENIARNTDRSMPASNG
jgi:hypothetical protein